MAKISLRAYNQEIGKLIEHGQNEEASAHCKYILKLFPKHLDTYRLLGKTYLESRRYSEAADILQRILAVVPDDFVAQIGLSIIREDEGNLDAAIWNMERAFEVQPSNAAVQEELRRLYGNRDGVQPPRVRLTRGALVRMYTKGNLYQQAIAEARAAIAESPKRTDLEILLAQNYYHSKNHAEAIEVCSRLVKKMPYCLEANRILAEILPKVNKADEAKVFAKRLHELDPYAAFIDNSTPNPAKVPDEAVTLEKLNWQPSMEDAEQPRWAKSIGVNIDEKSEEPAADWLNDMPAENADSSSPMPFIVPEISSAQSDEVLPGWMKEDEWSKTENDKASEESPQSNAFIMDDAEELQETEMPEWLQSLAPEQMDQGQPSTETSSFDIPEMEKTSEAPDWMNELDSDISKNSEVETPFTKAEPTDEEDTPEWMQELTTGEEEQEQLATPPESLADFSTAEANSETTLEVDAPDWLKEREASPEQTQEDSEKQPGVTDMLSSPVQEPETPDWLSDMNVETQPDSSADLTSDSPDEMPDWLENLEASSDQTASPTSEQPGLTDILGTPSQDTSLPDWLSDTEETAEAETPAPLKTAEETPDWLSELETTTPQINADADSPSVTDILSTPTQETEVPDWLSDIAPAAQTEPAPAEELPAEIFQEEPATESSPSAVDIPDWLQDMDSTSVVDQPETLQADESGIESTLPTAVASAAALLDSDEDEIAEQPPTAQPVEAVPEWLSDLESPQQVSSETPVSPDDETLVLPQKETAETSAQPSDEMPEDPDEAFAWLESLAAKHGAEEGALSTPLEERDTTAPDWLQKLEETSAEPQIDAVNEPEDENIPDVFQNNHITDEILPEENEPAVESTATDTALPDWLKDLETAGTESQPVPETPVQSTSGDQTEIEEETKISDAAPSDDLPDWLKDTDIAPAQELPVSEEPDTSDEPEITETPVSREAARKATLPDWMNELSEPESDELPSASSEEQPASPVEEQPEASVSLPDWMNESVSDSSKLLESLPEEEPSVTEPVAQAQKPEGTDVSLPDWMNELADADSAPETDEEPVEEEEENIPEWSRSTGIPANAMPPAEKSTSIPDWLTELKPSDIASEDKDQAEEPTQDAPLEPVVEETTTGKAAITEPEPEPESAPAAPTADMDSDDALLWLESLAAKHGADEEALVTNADERSETPPEWVQELSQESQPEAVADTAPEETAPSETFSIEELDTGVDLLSAAEEIPTEPAPQDEQDKAEAEAQQWLQSLASGKPMEEPVADKKIETAIPETQEEATPASLQEASPADEKISPAAEPQMATEMPEDPDAAFAWLESLAAQQGAEEEALSTPPEERDITKPEWLPSASEEPTSNAEVEQKEAPISEEPVEAAAPQEEPAVPPVAEESLTQPPHEAALPEWLKEFSDIPEEQAVEESAPQQEAPQDETIIRWLSDMEKEETPAAPPVEEPSASRSASEEVITEPIKPIDEPALEPEAEPLPSVPAEPDKPVVESLSVEAPVIEETVPAAEAPVGEPQLEPIAEPAPEPVADATPLTQAREKLANNHLQEAVDLYKPMIEKEEQLDTIIKDLNEALVRHPVDAILWLTLGDAFMQKKEIQSAISAYAKAEELLQ